MSAWPSARYSGNDTLAANRAVLIGIVFLPTGITRGRCSCIQLQNDFEDGIFDAIGRIVSATVHRRKRKPFAVMGMPRDDGAALPGTLLVNGKSIDAVAASAGLTHPHSLGALSQISITPKKTGRPETPGLPRQTNHPAGTPAVRTILTWMEPQARNHALPTAT